MIHLNDPMESERRKYEAMWAEPAYHQMSPGLEFVEVFVEVCKPTFAETLIDIGCGSGLAGVELARRGLQVTWTDLSDFTVDDVPAGRFIRAPIYGDWSRANKYGWDFGYCCDVMEHLPTEWTMLALDHVIRACRRSFFTIAHGPDQCGSLIGQSLHLTVQPFTWWRDRIAQLGKLIEARDLCGRGLFVVHQ